MKTAMTQEMFDRLKAFALRNNIASMINDLDAPIPSFDYSKNNQISYGEEISVRSHINPFFINTLKVYGTVITFSADEVVIKDTSHIEVEGQDFKPTEEQLNRIITDNFGAIILYGGSFHFLNKQQYDLNCEIRLEKETSEAFDAEIARLEKLYLIEKDFLDIKHGADEYGVQHYLSEWENPVFPPIRPTENSTNIKMTSFVSPNYFSAIRKGVEISYAENFDEETGRIKAINHTFAPTVEQAQALKQDGIAYLLDVGGYTHFQSKSQKEAELAYNKANDIYLKFSHALSAARDAIKNEKYADHCKKQHDRLSKLPFPYYVAIKVNVRLLTESSWGDGARKNTVEHIVPEIALTGRLKRKANEYLCGGNSSYGLDGKEHDQRLLHSIRHGKVKQEVTCKRCLELAEKLLKKAELSAN